LIFPDIPTKIRYYGDEKICRSYVPKGLFFVESVWNENERMGRSFGIKRQIVGNALIEVIVSYGLSYCNITAPYIPETEGGFDRKCVCGCHVAQGLIISIYLKDGTEIFDIFTGSTLYDVSYLDKDTYYTVAVCQFKTDYILFKYIRRVDFAAYQRGERVTVMWKPKDNDDRESNIRQDTICGLDKDNDEVILIPIDPVLSNYQV
jgi:hypothetical protein